jgi:hypothetical protein
LRTIVAKPKITEIATIFAPVITPITNGMPLRKTKFTPMFIIINIAGPGVNIKSKTANANTNILDF